jgi:hypothetical protein
MKFDSSLIRTGTLFAILLLFGSMWGLAGLTKLFGGLPPWFAESFGGTFLASFPGLVISFYSLVVFEVMAFVLVLVALVRGEFLPGRSTLITQAMLVVSLLLFVKLGFGQRLIGEFSGAASLFFYFAGTLLALDFVRKKEE